jgi:hypothetical protein
MLIYVYWQILESARCQQMEYFAVAAVEELKKVVEAYMYCSHPTKPLKL